MERFSVVFHEEIRYLTANSPLLMLRLGKLNCKIIVKMYL